MMDTRKIPITILRIEGPAECVKKCIAEIDRQKEVFQKLMKKQLRIDKQYHSHILSIKDSKLKQILPNVIINVPPINSNDDIIQLSGDQKEIENCCKYFLDLVDSLYEENFILPKEIAQQFIGKKNKNLIQNIELQTQTKIQHDRNVNKNGITLIGKKQNVEKARLLILETSKFLIDQEKQIKIRNSCFISRNLDVNFRLSAILSEKNEQWLKDFKSKFKNVHFELKDNQLKITPTEQIISSKEWIRKNESIIEEFLNQFFFEILDYDIVKQSSEIDDLKFKIENVRKLYLIDFMDKRDIGKLYFVGPRINVDDFAERNETFKRLSKFYQTKIDKNELIMKSIDVPVIIDFEKKIQNSLINKLLIRVQNMFNLKDYSLNINENRIEIHGLRNDVENSIDFLKNYLKNIQTKEIQMNLPEVIENCLDVISDLLENTESIQNHIYKLFVSNSNHLFVAYIFGIDSINDNLYKEINDLIVDNIVCLNLNVTMYSPIISTSKWKLFQQESLNSKVCSNNFRFNLLTDENGQIKIYLFGKKEYVIPMKIKILVILSENELKTKTLSLDEEDVIYFNF